jgi:hypothetical protein
MRWRLTTASPNGQLPSRGASSGAGTTVGVPVRPLHASHHIYNELFINVKKSESIAADLRKVR